MQMSPRLKQLLLIMLVQDKTFSVSALSEAIQVSKRTVQRELEYMPKALREYRLQFVSKTGVGVWIDGTPEDKQALLALLQEGDVQNVSGREYRRKQLTIALLQQKEVRKLFWYSSKFKVSEATISTDLEIVEKWLLEHHITLVRKPGSGISVEGKEEDCRRAIRAFMRENLDVNAMREAYHLQYADTYFQTVFQKAGIAQLLDVKIIVRVLAAMEGMQALAQIHLTEEAFLSLAVHLAISVQRIQQNQYIQTPEDAFEVLESDADYQFAQCVAQELAEEFELEFPKLEVIYICLHLKGAKHAKVAFDFTQNTQERDETLKSLVDDMIYAFDSRQAYLLKQDDEFLEGLFAHLQPTVVRLSHGMKIDNPVLPDIKREYALIFEKCKPVGYVLEEWLAKPVPEAELGFLTVHFGAALVRLEAKRENRRVVRVGVVCSSGIGISRLMAVKLTQIFREGIAITPYAKRDITPLVVQKEDFLVASMPLQCDGITVVNVTPLLNEKDIENIQLQMKRHEYTKAKQIVTQNARMGFGVVQILMDKIKAVTQQFTLCTLPVTVTFSQTVHAAAQHIAQEPTNQAEIAKVIFARERLATQIFPEFGFALLHAKTDAVTEPRFCAFTAPQNEPFADDYFGGIRIVFVMLIPKQEQGALNAELLGYLSGSLVEDDSFIQCVLSGQEAVVQEHLATLLETFFVRYINTLSGCE